MLEFILYPLIVAFISFLGWYAYTHPKSYHKLFPYLILFSFLGCLIVFVFNYSASLMLDRSLLLIDSEDSINAIQMVFEDTKISYTNSYISIVGYTAYISLLLYIKDILKQDIENK